MSNANMCEKSIKQLKRLSFRPSQTTGNIKDFALWGQAGKCLDCLETFLYSRNFQTPQEISKTNWFRFPAHFENFKQSGRFPA